MKKRLISYQRSEAERYQRSEAERYPRVAIGFLLVLGIGLAFMTGCVYEGEFPVATSEKEALVTFTIQMPGMVTPSTRATEEEEDEVKQIDILCFDPETEKYVYRASCDKSAIQPDNDSKNKTFTIPMRKGEFYMVMLANARDIIQLASPEGKTKQQVMASLEKNSLTPPFPMWGDIVEVKEINENTTITGVELIRMVARIEVQVNATDFKLTDVFLYNYNSKGSLAPKADEWTSQTGFTPNVPASPSVPIENQSPLHFSENTGNNLPNPFVFYHFEAENHTGEGHTTAKPLTERTCLVIGGKINTGGKTFYRLDFINNVGEILDIKRNHEYIFNIKKVDGPGYELKEAAFNAGPITVNIEAEVVSLDGSSPVYIVFDGQHYLAVSPEKISLSNESHPNCSFKVITDVMGGWKITNGAYNQLPYWLNSLSPKDGLKGVTTVTFNVDQRGSDAGERNYKFHITAGRLTCEVEVIQDI